MRNNLQGRENTMRERIGSMEMARLGPTSAGGVQRLMMCNARFSTLSAASLTASLKVG